MLTCSAKIVQTGTGLKARKGRAWKEANCACVDSC